MYLMAEDGASGKKIGSLRLYSTALSLMINMEKFRIINDSSMRDYRSTYYNIRNFYEEGAWNKPKVYEIIPEHNSRPKLLKKLPLEFSRDIHDQAIKELMEDPTQTTIQTMIKAGSNFYI